VDKAFRRDPFHQKGDFLEQVDASQRSIQKKVADKDDIMKLNGYNHGLKQLRPGSSQRYLITLREN
jgi:hypothetical protein